MERSIIMENKLGPEIAGALARFWAGGLGPSHSSISTAFALAGYNEPPNEENKQQRVMNAIRRADPECARRIVEELLVLLRSGGAFDEGAANPMVESSMQAFARAGSTLSAEGYVDWTDEAVGPAKESPTMPPRLPETQETHVPNVELLCDSLRRIASAMRPLVKRRRARTAFVVNDEYDLQDMVEVLLRTLYNDVRPEERTPSYAGSSSTIDFLIREMSVAVEVKVTRPGRGERDIKTELLVDISDYKGHPRVNVLIAVVYDIASTIDNPAGFESDLSGYHNDLGVRVIVVGWPLPLD